MPATGARAALLVIGNEILSGRTREGNLAVLAQALNARGIRLAEAQVVRDEPSAIIAATNTLRATYDYLFTSGGIGPTHDDITTACVAQAFGVTVERHPEAEAELRAHYTSTGREASAARLRMANIPNGARLIRCGATPAPGFQLDNVFVLAGVPHIFQAMTAQIVAGLAAGPAYASRTITVHVGESEVAAQLAAVQDAHPELELGSYPQQRGERYHAELVVAGTDPGAIATALAELTASLDGQAIRWKETTS